MDGAYERFSRRCAGHLITECDYAAPQGERFVLRLPLVEGSPFGERDRRYRGRTLDEAAEAAEAAFAAERAALQRTGS